MFADSSDALELRKEVEARLDGIPVAIPAERRSLNAICGYFEILALQRQRVLCSLLVDGKRADLAELAKHPGTFCRIEAETAALDQTDPVLLFVAQQQTARILTHARMAVTRVLISDVSTARVIWRTLAGELKEPVLTLSVLPEDVRKPRGVASSMQLRKWQLEQLASLISAVESASQSEDVIQLSDALESLVLPWVQCLHDLITLRLENTLARVRSSRTSEPYTAQRPLSRALAPGCSETPPSS